MDSGTGRAPGRLCVLRADEAPGTCAGCGFPARRPGRARGHVALAGNWSTPAYPSPDRRGLHRSHAVRRTTSSPMPGRSTGRAGVRTRRQPPAHHASFGEKDLVGQGLTADAVAVQGRPPGRGARRGDAGWITVDLVADRVPVSGRIRTCLSPPSVFRNCPSSRWPGLAADNGFHGIRAACSPEGPVARRSSPRTNAPSMAAEFGKARVEILAVAASRQSRRPRGRTSRYSTRSARR